MQDARPHGKGGKPLLPETFHLVIAPPALGPHRQEDPLSIGPPAGKDIGQAGPDAGVGQEPPAGQAGNHVLDKGPETMVDLHPGETRIHGLLQPFDKERPDLLRPQDRGVEKGFFHPRGPDKMNPGHPHDRGLLENPLQHDGPGQGQDQLKGGAGWRFMVQAHAQLDLLPGHPQNPALATAAVDHAQPQGVAGLQAKDGPDVPGPPAGEPETAVPQFIFRKKQQVHGSSS